ncbi:MAG TPA: hypothetical protein VNO26_05380 [Candidatus Limnocylindria bacterium]|nr:hypothetical protein [Candidatus Limnocylindria bacterium]
MTFPAHRAVGACVFGLVAALGVVAGAQDQQQPGARVIKYRDDRLTVDLVRVPLGEVLAEIARQSQAEIRGELREPRDVTARFEDVPLADALDRLLGTQNYALIYGEDGSLRAIPLLSGSTVGSAPSFSLRPASAGTPSTVVPPAGLAALLAAEIPISGPVAEKLGSDKASLGQLANLWLHESDPTVGAQSLRSGFKAIEGSPGLRSATLDMANNYSDADLARLFRGFAGGRAEELVDIIASQSKVSEFRSKATMVLRRLQSGS